MNIYIVEGNTGEYSDHQDWPVAAYYSEDKAKAHVLAADERARVLYAEAEAADKRYYDITKGANEHDPNMKTDYTGTRYFYYPVEIKDTISK